MSLVYPLVHIGWLHIIHVFDVLDNLTKTTATWVKQFERNLFYWATSVQNVLALNSQTTGDIFQNKYDGLFLIQ